MSMAEYIVNEGVLHEKAVKGLRTIKQRDTWDAASEPAGGEEAAASEDRIECVFPEPL